MITHKQQDLTTIIAPCFYLKNRCCAISATAAAHLSRSVRPTVTLLLAKKQLRNH